MSYRRPAVTVIQEFIGLVPALAAFTLPSCVVAPAYQIVNNDELGSYAAVQATYAYASLLGGASVDLEELASDEMFPVTKKPVSVYLKDAKVEIVAPATTGNGSGTAFADASLNKFANVLAGDEIVITEELAVSIVSAQTDGSTVATAGLRDRLTAGTPGQFANVKIGDTVDVTAGTNTNVSSFTVTVKISNDVIKVDADINDGVGPSTDVAYSITGDRGTANQGRYRVKTKTDSNNLILESPLVEAEAPISYSIQRTVAQIDLVRIAAPGDGFFPQAAGITLGATLTYLIGVTSYNVVAGDVFASYRALRTDKAASVVEYENIDAVKADFGVDQIVPANPLAYGLSLMLQNTVTAINGLGLDANAVSDEVLSHTEAASVMSTTDMYCIVILSHNVVVHQLWKTHVEGFSQPEKRKERVVVVNRLLKTVETLKEEDTTVTTLNGSRIIVNTQADGAGVVAFPSVVNDATTGQFANVEVGDSLVVVSGTNATPGTYPVASVQSDNSLTVTGSLFTGTCSDLVYYIVRKDGLGADGMTFYDRNATFISDGVAAGHYLEITAGTYLGRYLIGTVVSEKEFILGTAIPGVATLQTAISYKVTRNMTKTEQANFVKGYSAGLASRRVVHTWPDILKSPVGQVVEDLPGYYAGCTVGAMTTGLPTQQGFTNISVSGFLGLDHSSRYFNDDQLDIMADGGTMIFAQDKEETALYIRHQLTTDRSAIKFQEYSITKNVDFVAKFVRDSFKNFPGKYNIVDTAFDDIKTTSKAVMSFLKDDTKLPRIGGVIKGGTLKKLEQGEQIDSIKMRFKFDIPIPLNNLDITIEV